MEGTGGENVKIDELVGMLQERIGYRFRDEGLAIEALTHSSYAFERKINKIACNERLEFLGDAVLEQISSEFIFRHYPKMPEGKMSRLRASLVCEEALSACAEKIGLGELLLLGKGEEAGGGRKKASVTSDAYEAVIGAMYLDGGLDAARTFVEREVLSDIEGRVNVNDPKSALQERVQSLGDGKIEYRVVSESGPEHDKTFLVEVSIDGRVMGSGSGHNKKGAEKEAAAQALKKMNENLDEGK